MPLKIATWNVNSLRVRLAHVSQWAIEQRPDMLCLQETKTTDQDFPLQEIEEAGYHAAYSGQRTYNGVAILSRLPLDDVLTGLPGLEDAQRRFLAATMEGTRIVNVYVPNGQEVGSEKFTYKLDWLDHLVAWVSAELDRFQRLVLVGDFNIAPGDADVHDPERWRGKVLFSEPEHAAFRRLIAAGLGDAFRKFEQPAGAYSWWDYRAGAYRRNHGLRIDHILASTDMLERCTACSIDATPRGWERPSDHAPVMASFSLD